ncbi:peptidoglycan DD-metalloendopeptidase family protein [Acidiphilium acidophilum]|uniref:murein hydrolase activator EnvC family protein n=1 Tax=Acidiphilium acidophilum TaxID=76588 RepID=UPI002E8E619A|nr:peptidoglycan DD-metalloendopeptidase family protein [Acidiphilium acidophilum]
MRRPPDPRLWRRWRGSMIAVLIAGSAGQGVIPNLASAAQGSGPIDQAEHRLDAANLAAQHHAAAAAAAQRAARIADAQAAALVSSEITAAATLRETQDQTALIVAKLDRLTTATAAARAKLEADAAAIAPLLPLIARLALHPAATLLAADAAPGKAAEGALVMQGITREIGQRAASLRRARRRYAHLSTALTAQQAALTLSITTQQAQEAVLQRRIAAVRQQAATLSARHAAEAREASADAAQARSLVGLIGRLRHQQAQAAAARARAAAARIPAPAGNLPKSLSGAPVAGTLVRGFGQASAAGPATGDTFAATPGAVVTAACTGNVVFAQPFQSYGKLMIIDCGQGYDFVMAGFDRFDAAVGQTVRAGQPVGSMARYDPHDPGNQPRLYVELRHHGAAIDPAGHFGAGAAAR